MEGNDWYNTGYTDYRNHYRGDDRPIDQDVFRGSYRFDNESRHHRETTYDDLNRRGQRHESSRTYERRPGNYSLSGQRMYDNDYPQHYQDTYNYSNRGRHQDNDRDRNRQDYRQHNDRDRDERMYRSTNIGGNFEGNYGRDSYNNYNQDENYGNMAGSLSWGYDGDNNANKDENRHYNPLTGRRHSYHGNYTSRHPDQTDPRLGRSFDRNSGNDYERY